MSTPPTRETAPEHSWWKVTGVVGVYVAAASAVGYFVWWAFLPSFVGGALVARWAVDRWAPL